MVWQSLVDSAIGVQIVVLNTDIEVMTILLMGLNVQRCFVIIRSLTIVHVIGKDF